MLLEAQPHSFSKLCEISVQVYLRCRSASTRGWWQKFSHFYHLTSTNLQQVSALGLLNITPKTKVPEQWSSPKYPWPAYLALLPPWSTGEFTFHVATSAAYLICRYFNVNLLHCKPDKNSREAAPKGTHPAAIKTRKTSRGKKAAMLWDLCVPWLGL